MHGVSKGCSLCIGENPSICPFFKTNGDEAPKEASPIIFLERTDTRFSPTYNTPPKQK